MDSPAFGAQRAARLFLWARTWPNTLTYSFRKRRFNFVIAEQVLHTTVGNDDIMIGQLDRLLIAMALPRVVLGIVPSEAEFVVPISNFCMFDRRRVLVETISAELTVTQPRERMLYEKNFKALAEQALRGDAARALIRAAVGRRSERLSNHPDSALDQ
ncbi:Scr1 family TA system antitoxin-like transcriptional regulator [Nocardia tengchongensis]|uniref:Scr1 family TA system antitoxin-like transcriptional regulator n=1 Tax=Nocardia tengchongensis TaxID=2055889 RepID=UPI0036BBB2E2